MTLLRFDPFRSFESSTRKMMNLFDELNRGITFEAGNFKPRVDITEDSANIYLVAEMPGVSKESLKVSVNEDNELILKGTKTRSDSENQTYHRNERFFGDFERTFVLPDNLATDKISAKFENGVLELSIPKVEPEKPKEVNVEIK